MKLYLCLITVATIIGMTAAHSANGAERSLYSAISEQQEAEINQQVEKLLSNMTLEEKVRHISGMRDGFDSKEGDYDGFCSIERLGIPPFKIYHGPYGMSVYKYAKHNGTYYPSCISMASTWNTELVEKVTTSLGKELKASGGQSNAGPSMNIIRDLRCGRNSEYFTEDPFLNGKMAAAYVRGLQSQGNVAIMKHFLCNNQERNRNFIDVTVSERALREIYLPGYKRAVTEGGVLGVMTGYNYVNGHHNSAYKHLLQDVLKDEWGFKGVVMTDWVGSAENAKVMIDGGLDCEMPVMFRLRVKHVLDLLKKGEVTEDQIDEKVRRILYVTCRTGILDKKPVPNPDAIATPETVQIAREAAEEAFVLLKNEKQALPLNRDKIKKVAVIGPSGAYGAHFRRGQPNYQMLQGGGSATISPPKGKMITPLEGIKNKAGNNEIEIVYEPGCYGDHGCSQIPAKYFAGGLQAEYFANNQLEGTSTKQVDKDIAFTWWKTPQIIEAGNENQGGKTDNFSVRWTGKLDAPETRTYTFETQVQGTAQVYIDGELIVNKHKPGRSWDAFAMGTVHLEKGMHDIRVEYKKTIREARCHLLWDYGNDEYLKKAVELAKTADAVIMPMGTSGMLETEALDRDEIMNRSDSLALSAAQEKLIQEVAKVNDRVVVVTFTAGVTCNQWKDEVEGIIYGGFPGQEVGNALGSIIWGDVNPSGRLPVTIPQSVDQFPEDFHSKTLEIEYKEGIYVGYRYFDKNNIEPAFPFGHGLSYTSFKYGKPQAKRSNGKGAPVNVVIPVTNTGKVTGKEVVQLYVRDPEASTDRPEKELKAFEKIELQPGETKQVKFVLNEDAFSYFCEKENDWKLEPGTFEILIGSTSDDVRAGIKIELN